MSMRTRCGLEIEVYDGEYSPGAQNDRVLAVGDLMVCDEDAGDYFCYHDEPCVFFSDLSILRLVLKPLDQFCQSVIIGNR